MTPFRRDGHLTDLALDILLEDGQLEGADAHLASCAVCRDRLEAAGAIELPANPFLQEDGLPKGASVAPEPAQTTAANRPWMWAVLLATAAAAVLTFLALPGDTDTDGIRLKGGGVSLQVFRDEGPQSGRLRNGDTIAAGDRLGFRVRNRDDGHLIVLGIDADDEAYLCYPQRGGGNAEARKASPQAVQLPEAIRMDATPGTERLIAVFCDQPFTFDDAVEAVHGGVLPEDCTMDEVALVKR